ncbi:MAG: RHS repeat-associated core domain-containing protein, partial [Dermatophilaceae bacterium]
TGRAGVPASGVSAVVVNLTAVGGSTNSFLTAHPDGTTRPGVSNLNFATGETVANAAIVKVSPSGAIKIYNSTGSVHVLADVTGFYTAPGGVNGTTTAASTYIYNGDGFRVSKTTVTTSGTTSSTATAAFTYDQSLGIPVLLSDGERDYIYGPDGLPLQHLTTTGANPAWYLSDHNGNTRALADATGAVTATYTYTAYGTPTRTSGTASTPLLYGQGHYDTDTGYIYLLHRYYDPATATFTTTDPLLSISGSPYGYVGGDPLNVTDPTGLFPPLLLAFAVGALIEGGIELATQAARNTAAGCGPLDNINWGDVAASAAIGGLTRGTSRYLRAANGGTSTWAKVKAWSGREYKFGPNFRIAPFGNRTGHPTGRYPHYHRRVVDDTGETLPGQGIGRHRPWDKKSTDTSFWDRF